MNWDQIEAVFELLFLTEEWAVMVACVKELRNLGLADNQIHNGLIAGNVQIALDHGRSVEDLVKHLNVEDQEIVMSSVVPLEMAA